MRINAEKEVDDNNFDKEKTVKLGRHTFVIRHEYSGSKQIGELITNLIIRNATSGM